MPRDIQLARGNAQDFPVRSRNDSGALRRALMEHCRAIPHVVNEKSPCAHMLASSFKCGQDILILELIAKNRKHHQGSVKFVLEFDTADVSCAIGKFGLCECVSEFVAGLAEHALRAFYADDFVSTGCKRKRVVTRAATEIENARNRFVAVPVEDVFYQITLSGVVFVEVEQIVSLSVCGAKGLIHLSTLRTASHTVASCSSVKLRPEGR